MEILEILGCLTGLAGAFLLSSNSKNSGYGFVLFLLSNLCWIAFGVINNVPAMVVMQIGFTYTSLRGIHRWKLISKHQPEVN